jgi:SAM-dependent methyltransferase
MSSLKSFAKRSKPLVIAATIAKDVRSGVEFKLGRDLTTNGSTHESLSMDESLAYIDAVYDDFLRYGGLTSEDLKGARVLEIGPGDNFGVGLRMLAAGASQVICADRFYSIRDADQQRRIYTALIDRMSDAEKAAVEGVVDLSGGGDVTFDERRLKYEHGIAIEEADGVYEHGSFDLIVSRAVMEHVYDTDAALASMDRLLRPGGAMLHKIDFRDHGMFSAAGHNELEFLTISDRVYHLMSYRSGRPNRRLFDYYRAKVTEMGYDHELLVTHVVGSKDDLVPHRSDMAPEEFGERARAIVRDVRPRLAPRFRSLPDEDLMISGLFLVARKPGGDQVTGTAGGGAGSLAST